MEMQSFGEGNTPPSNGGSGRVTSRSGTESVRVGQLPGGAVDVREATLPQALSTDPISVRVLQPGTNINVNANLLIWDHDETICEGTGEHFHDGHVARFARGLSAYLIALHHRSGGDLLTSGHLETFENTGSIFSVDEWRIYRGQSGKSEDGVLAGMLAIADERFGLSGRGLSPSVLAFGESVETVSNDQFLEFMKPVRATEGTREVLTAAGIHGVKSVVVSASKHKYVARMLEHNHLKGHVHTVIGNAQKKVDATTFEKKDIEKGCADAGVDSRQAVMFGDSIGDVAAAARAGVGTIIIRTGRSEPPTEQASASTCSASTLAAWTKPETNLRNQVDTFQNLERYRSELLAHGYPISVLLVEEFSQVTFKSGIAQGANASFYLTEKDYH